VTTVVVGASMLRLYAHCLWHTQEFCLGGDQQIQLRTERTEIWGQ